MKKLNEIPQRQNKRPRIKRYKINDFTTRSERIHTILAYVFAYLFGVMLFVYAYISLIAF